MQSSPRSGVRSHFRTSRSRFPCRFEPFLRGHPHAAAMRNPRPGGSHGCTRRHRLARERTGRPGRQDRDLPGGATPTMFPAGTPFWVGYGFAADPRWIDIRRGDAVRARRGRQARLDAHRGAPMPGYRCGRTTSPSSPRSSRWVGTTSPGAGTTKRLIPSPAARRSSSWSADAPRS